MWPECGGRIKGYEVGAMKSAASEPQQRFSVLGRKMPQIRKSL
jgi:hypothetical protein